MAATKFTETEREKLFAQLEAPFDPAQIKWRVMRTYDNGRIGVILPFADPRAYTDRLNSLFTPSGWTREYTISTVPSLCRMERGKAIVTSKVLVATALTITRLGSHTGTGEEWADRENAVTSADAQAFKRACSCFGLGRYLYRFGETRVRLNSRGEPLSVPSLPEWALPPGMTVAQVNGMAGDTRGPVDQRLTAEIESFRATLGMPIYGEILRRAGHSRNARTIPNAERQKQTVEWMQASARGFERLRSLAETAGGAQFTAVVERFKIASVTEVPSLAVLKQLIEELESLAKQQVAERRF
ncbi:MAG TPA: Rad52/Rad22 family DNA repair protein, partial [Candidatus Sulfotelmatobacter sp.]|nr:Rad52/Rad22 family DNA repair protein [Candidatus Sulfotelmatobacter sp.]